MFSDNWVYPKAFGINGVSHITLCDRPIIIILPASTDSLKFSSYALYLGNENAAKVDCPDPLLGSFNYTYTEKKVTYCANVNTATINACDAATFRTHVIVDNTGCTAKKPFYSSA
ncbi:hypothetical protein DPMN_104026 [Dreissena polymorpha]|uniref:Uncharacterized protein n=1 Tax=Dreissena polymorpha TaxID=45954 RepID=A0A9D4HC93_DREPO|nr:hypothetical protein DPMN_104026 [Dreissena polymorpha]